MKKHLLNGLLACALAAHACCAMAAAEEFSFGVISAPFKAASGEEVLRESIAETDADNLAFVVANGIKSRSEPCSDSVYNARRALFDSAKNGLIVSLAASDWTDCKGANGKSAAIGRLSRLRELFFADEMSMGTSRIPMMRQSTTPKFRSYAENARWELGKTMFATVNLPANNNHYLTEAGRNSEFEDRLIANRAWLHGVFTHARLKKLEAVVLFCDGNPFAKAGGAGGAGARRDGFAEARQQITALATKFPGKVLVVHAPANARRNTSTGIVWRNNLGVLEAGFPWTRIRVAPSPARFEVLEKPSSEAKVSPASDTVR
ncbi:MAG: hypothetical protein V7642_2516 [Burkholderiales bacterium]